MTTLIIKEDVKLPVKEFNTYWDLVDFVLYENSILKIQKLNKEEKIFLYSLNYYKNFKKLANEIWK